MDYLKIWIKARLINNKDEKVPVVEDKVKKKKKKDGRKERKHIRYCSSISDIQLPVQVMFPDGKVKIWKIINREKTLREFDFLLGKISGLFIPVWWFYFFEQREWELVG